MAIRLKKDDSTRMNITKFWVGLGWTIREDATNSEDFDLDVSAFMLDSKGKIPTDNHLVFYNSEKRLRVDEDGKPIRPMKIEPDTRWSSNKEMREQSRPVDPDMSVIGALDDDGSDDHINDGDAETISIDLERVPANIQRIVITVSIYEAFKRNQNFGQVSDAYVRIYAEGNDRLGQEKYIYDLTGDFPTSRSIEFVEFIRNGTEWDIKALGKSLDGELDELVGKYT